MIEIDKKSLELATEDIQDMADDLDDAAKKHSSNSVYDAIENAIDGEIINPVLRKARKYAEPHVGDRVETIQPVGGSWQGNTYQAGLTSDNEVVLSHEFGTGQYTSSGPYKIRPNDGQALSFEINGYPIAVSYVVHPGVRGKRFMQRAVQERADEITREALDEAQQTIEEALST